MRIKKKLGYFTTKRKLENLGKRDFISKYSPFVHSSLLYCVTTYSMISYANFKKGLLFNQRPTPHDQQYLKYLR